MPEKTYPRSDVYRVAVGKVQPLLASLLILLLVGCRPPTPPPAPGVTAAPAPTKILLPTTTPSSGPTDGVGAIPELLAGLTDRLEADWNVVSLTGDALAAVTGDATVATDTVVARYSSTTGDPGAPAFTVLMSPRSGLSLDAYMDQVVAALAATGGVDAGGVTIRESRLDYGLREDGAPAALIRFQADGALFGAEGITVEGMQAAVLDPSAANIVVITLTSDGSRSDQLEPLLKAVVNGLVQSNLPE